MRQDIFFTILILGLLSHYSVNNPNGQSWTSALLQKPVINDETCPINCYCRSNIINCRRLNLTKLPPSKDLPSDANILDIKYNFIKFLPSDHFRHLKRLKTLQLNNNKIRGIKKYAFRGLHNLRHLYLYKNRIRYLDRNVFQGLSKLERVYLHYNHIKSVPNGIFHNLPQLEKVFLGYNKIASLSEDVFDKGHVIRVLRLDHNPLVCDCHLNWFRQFVEFDEVGLIGSCNRPSNLRGSRLYKVYWNHQECSNSVITKESRLVVDAQRDGGIQRPLITKEPTDADVNPGGSTFFTCKASGVPSPFIIWKKDGHKSISSASLSDVGSYQCIANSPSGVANSQVARLRYYRSRSQPRITHSPTRTDVLKGETIRLTCGATGFPTPTFSWFKDGGRLSSFHDRFSVGEDGTLTITNAQLDDSAHYRCSATNYLGRASSAARVRVNLAIPDSKPIFTSNPRNAKSMEGGIVEFTCISTGHPYPDTTWWKNNRIVSSDNRITVSDSGQHLRIQNVRLQDRGEYTCRAENAHGISEVSANLTVQSRPTPIVMLEIPHDMNAGAGSTVQLACRASGYPKPSITWKKDGRPITESYLAYRLSPDGSLILFNVSRVYNGNYQCVASNDAETKQSNAVLSVFIDKEKNCIPCLPQDCHLYHKLRDLPLQFAQIFRPSLAEGFIAKTFSNKSNLLPNLDTSDRISALFPPESSGPLPGDDFLLTAFDEAQNQVMKAIDGTVKSLFSGNKSHTAPHTLRKIFRFPGANVRELAQATEVFERTLNLVEKAVRSGNIDGVDLDSNFTYKDLISTENLYLLANLSGCESHRSESDLDCTRDLCFHSMYRTIDGTCNNYEYPLRGASLTTFKRLMLPEYENTFNLPKGWDREKLYNGYKMPSARAISSTFSSNIFHHSMEAISQKAFEDGITCSGTCGNRPPCFPIEVPLNDPRISNHRSVQYREQLNQLTSYIDASQVYGSEHDLAQNLRNLTNNFGRLREEQIPLEYPKPFLPFNIDHPVDCRRDPRASNIGCFLAGDVRANEQLGLLSMHTIWFRQHNFIKIIGAQMQHITYSHWLPLIIGNEGMELIGPYQGYDPSIDSSISNVFATAAFRFGHTLINPILLRLNRNFSVIDEGHLSLHEAFFSPWRLVQEGGVDPILRGLFISPAKKPDPSSIMNDELTEKLFEAAHNIALDLGALNIQRGRDHGMPSYLKWREFCGFDSIESWSDLATAIPNHGLRTKLKTLYGDVRNIDLWRLRDGDRFWYENPSVFTPEQMSQIKVTSLGGVLCDNGDEIDRVVKNVFLSEMMNEKIKPIRCEKIQKPNLNPWFECNKNEENNWKRSSRNRRDTSNEFYEQVCINYDGTIKRDGDSWVHKDEYGTCASCICNDQQVDCRSIPSCSQNLNVS
ncbi:PXDN [Lepeophtheirus salmonis]|uniref:PXDN n=1 Tax=Lepeophtheirus salmonis TaxID=72036 RepID=A0A7R8CUN4_LEPSM|nr:PXDN [Lepeophtheirus salmonis]CAF2886549.1 PXDN [Lepeophtheirus salmonis]